MYHILPPNVLVPKHAAAGAPLPPLALGCLGGWLLCLLWVVCCILPAFLLAESSFVMKTFFFWSICTGVWDKILEPVACVRKQSEMLQLFPAYLKGEDLFGLTVSAVARIAESVSADAAGDAQCAVWPLDHMLWMALPL